MEIIVHAGLHKSGSTSLQEAWRESYADTTDVFYPARGSARLPGHHHLFWPHLSAFTEHTAIDLLARSLGPPPQGDLGRVVRRADRRGVGTLLLSPRTSTGSRRPMPMRSPISSPRTGSPCW